jgi:hypothetical protein
MGNMGYGHNQNHPSELMGGVVGVGGGGLEVIDLTILNYQNERKTIAGDLYKKNKTSKKRNLHHMLKAEIARKLFVQASLRMK